MSIYHRTFTRTPLSLDVELQCKGKKLKPACTRDINPFGAFIELSEPELRPNDFVSLYFTNEAKSCQKVEQKGMVMHCSKEGVGILFANDSDEFRSMLQQELKHAD